jgi:SpoVK/Ycf46/Vps4 family AAA+-type ATPase
MLEGGMRLVLAVLALATAAHAEDIAPTRLQACLAASDSRYIRETERNLSRVFDVAERSDAALFFDEADALFGARSEAREAHDRYANQEVSYLIARIEEVEGVQLLASNNRRTLTAGFNRRARNTGIVVIETETGLRVLELTRTDRRRALQIAEATLSACPP